MVLLRSPRGTPRERFWAWFVANETALFEFERDQDRIFAELARTLHAIHPDLTFEFGPVRSGRREFVLSADGIRAAFPEVVALADAAPALPRWQVTKFRPRRSAPGEIRIGDVLVHSDDVSFLAEADNSRVELRIFIQGYRPTANSIYEQIAFLLLDHELGEFDVETKLGHIEIGPPLAVVPGAARPLGELARLIDGVAVT